MHILFALIVTFPSLLIRFLLSLTYFSFLHSFLYICCFSSIYRSHKLGLSFSFTFHLLTIIYQFELNHPPPDLLSFAFY
jgi:hypothetical protein